MVYISAYDFVDRCQRVGVGYIVVIQRSAEEMLRGIGQEELHGRGCVSLQIVIDAEHAFFGIGVTLLGDSVRLDGVVEHEADRLVSQLAEVVLNGFVTAMDARVECGIDYVHPVRFGVVQLGVDICYARVLKPIGIALQIRTLITVLRDVNPVVTERTRL